ncbi:TonB family protein [Providencia sp. Je.9.19]|uniref:TonB family protein n=1 Tax=Providencia sp. Je.9.19 TaxID=3142844 RepID=UPI003DA87501
MTFSYFQRYNIALVISLGIHLAIVAFIALQTGRALPLVEGANVITLSLGGPASSGEGLGYVKNRQSEASINPLDQEGAAAPSSKISPPTTAENSLPKASQPENRQIHSTAEDVNTLENKQPPKEDSLDSHYVIPKKSIEKPLKTTLSRSEAKPTTNVNTSRTMLDKQAKSSEKQINKNDKWLPNTAQKTSENTVNEVQKSHSKTPEKENISTKVNTDSTESTGAGDSVDNISTTGIGSGKEDLTGNAQFIANGDGSYTALGSGGISYKILNDAEPKYPKEARTLGYSKIVKVQIRLLVGLDGRIASVEVLNDNIPDLGFREEAIAAIKTMSFEPIIYKEHPIKMYFKKTVVFQY